MTNSNTNSENLVIPLLSQETKDKLANDISYLDSFNNKFLNKTTYYEISNNKLMLMILVLEQLI